MASTYLSRTFSTNGNRKKFTVSVWVKKSQFASGKAIWGSDDGSGAYVWFIVGSGLYFQQNPSSTIEFNSSALLRDVNGWYHIVQQVDTAQATNTNRMKFWINGEQVTSWSTSTYPSQNSDLNFTSSSRPLQIGMYGSAYWDGLMSHFHWCDGYAYEASDFGQYDANGVWTIKTSPSVTYGTNGFFILKDGNSVTDQSGNGNNFTVAGGTLTNTEDNPSNVFCTVDPLTNPSVSYSNGNLTINGGDDVLSTMGVTSGKWYWEAKITNLTGIHYGIAATTNSSGSGSQIYTETNTNSSYIWLRNNDISNRNGTGISNANVTSSHSSVNTNDIIGTALDLDSATKKVTFYKNGSEVGYVTFDYDTSIPIFPFFRMNTGSASNINFGNGYFGTTAVASAGTNASGNGIFEYDVPTGYTALCTKGLNGE